MDVYDIANLKISEFKKHVSALININTADATNGATILQAVVAQQEEDGFIAEDIYDKTVFLLEKGSSINHQSHDGRTAMHDLLFESAHPSVSHQNKMVNLLLDNGADINIQDNFGATPLQYAIANNALSTQDNTTMYVSLLEAGADYRLKDNFNHDIMYYCHEFPWRTDVIPLIQKYGQYPLS